MKASENERDRAAREEALAFVAAMERFWRARLGDDLLGLYLLGSLAHGGFNSRYSDIDVAVITESGLDDDLLAESRAEAETVSPALALKLSIFWTDRAFATGRFPPLDRVDYLDHGRALYERERIAPARPGTCEIRAWLAGAPFARWKERALAFAGAETLGPAEHKPYLRAQLYPARFAYSWITGDMASNDTAVAYLRDAPPDGLDIALLERALACRHAAADPDALFAERGALPAQVAACERLMDR